MFYRLTILTLLTMAISLGIAKPQTARLSYQVKITGIQNDALNNAISRLAINQKSVGRLTPYKIKTLYRTSSKAIQAAIEPYGYFRSSINANLTRNGNSYQAIFNVTPGNPIKIMHLNIKLKGEGIENPALLTDIANSALKKGMVLNVPIYQKAKTKTAKPRAIV